MPDDVPVEKTSWLRAILIGLAIIPLNTFWVQYMEMVTNSGGPHAGNAGPYPTALTIFANVVFIVFVITIVNHLVCRRWRGLSRQELLVIYIILAISSAVTSLDFLDALVPSLAYPIYAASPQNDWARKMLEHWPRWAYVTDYRAVKDWFLGNSTLYTWEHIRAWLTPALIWSGFAIVLLFMMLCVNTILRKQWTQNERLSFPLIQLPLDLTDPEGRLLRDKLMWLGFGIAAAISILNGLHQLAPTLPFVNVKKQNLAVYITQPPWNAIDWLPVAFYPFAIGIGFLLPVDLSFSCWFFYFFWQFQKVLSAVFGWSDITPGFPYINQQSLGAYLQIAVFALFSARRHIAGVFRQALTTRREKSVAAEDDPMPYRIALLGLIGGFIFVNVFFGLLGLPAWFSILAFALYLLICVAIARMRAELGPPAHDLPAGGPDSILPSVMGTSTLGSHVLVPMAWLGWFNLSYRSLPIGTQLESYRMGERSAIPARVITLAIALSSLSGVFCGFWGLLHYGYVRGAATAKMAPHFVGQAAWSFARTDWWLADPKGPDYLAAAGIGFGFLLAAGLWLLKGCWMGSPFHPLGLAISATWAMSVLWMPLLIAWACKAAILRVGGLKSYRRFLPLFLGLILGDFVVGCIWPLLGLVFGVNMYSFQG